MWWRCCERVDIKRHLGLASADVSTRVETVTRALTASLCRASLFDGANQDHDWYLAPAASPPCLEACFSKETTEGQLLSAELFSLLSMCALAVCPWPTDPEQQLDLTSNHASLSCPPQIHPNMHFCVCLKCAHKTLFCFFLPLRQKPDAGS